MQCSRGGCSACASRVRAVAAEPTLGLALVAVWAVLAKFKRLYAVPAAVLAALILIAVTSPIPLSQMGPLWPHPVLVMPRLSLPALIGIALPLFIVNHGIAEHSRHGRADRQRLSS